MSSTNVSTATPGIDPFTRGLRQEPLSPYSFTYNFRLFPSRHLYFFFGVRYHPPPNGTEKKAAPLTTQGAHHGQEPGRTQRNQKEASQNHEGKAGREKRQKIVKGIRAQSVKTRKLTRWKETPPRQRSEDSLHHPPT